MYVNEAMTTSVCTCQPTTTLDKIARKMWAADCGAIPIVDEGNKPVGMVTDRDIAMAAMLNNKPLWELTASTIMQDQQVHCISQFESIESCLATMEKYRVRRLPVIADSGKLVGIVSLTDALAMASSQSDSNPVSNLGGSILKLLRKLTERCSERLAFPQD